MFCKTLLGAPCKRRDEKKKKNVSNPDKLAMFSQIIKRSIVRAPLATRAFTSSAARFNVIQDLYLREIKSVKLQPIAAKDAEGSVKPWSAPAQPKLPELEAQGADALKAYSEQDVEVSKDAASAESSVENEEQDWLVLEEIEDDHHH